MTTLAEQVSAYAAYHRNMWNRLTHFVGVPIVIFALFIPLGWFRLVHVDTPFSAAMLFYGIVTCYYLRLDWKVTLLQAPFTLGLLYAAEQVSLMPWRHSMIWFFSSFSLGWAIQFLGHVFEGRRPAFVDNLWQVFNAPLFLAVEALALVGVRAYDDMVHRD